MADAPAPRRRRWLRRILVILFAVAVLIFFAPAIAARTGLVQSLASTALADFDGTLTIGAASLGWFAPVELTDVSLKDRDGRTLLAAPKIVTTKTLFRFLADSKNLGTVTLQQPALEIVCAGDTTNWETSLKKLLEKPAEEQTAKPTVAIALTDATLKVIDADAKQEWAFSGVQASVDVGAALRAQVQIAQPDRLECDLSLAPQLQATILAEHFPVEVAGPLLRRFEPGLVLAGRLSGSADTTADDSGMIIKGDLHIDDFQASSPRLGSDRIAFSKVELPFKLRSHGTAVQVDVAKLTCPVGEATFIGRIDTANPAAIAQQPGVQASVNLDLAKLAKMLPHVLRLKPGTELSEGRIEAHLTSLSGAEGAMWDGTLKASALQGSRDGLPLRWEQPVLASFRGKLDAAAWPEFERLEVASDFARVSARGKLETFEASASVSFDALAKHLAEFIDLRGITLAGKADLTARGAPEQGGTTLASTLKLYDLAAAYRGPSEPQPRWQLAAHGDLAGSVRSDSQHISVRGLTGSLKNVRFRGLGLDVDEPILNVLPTEAVYNRATRALAIPRLQVATQTLSLGASDIVGTAEGVSFTGALNLDLRRFQRTLQLAGEPISGIVQNGTLEGRLDNGVMKLKAVLPVANFAYGTLWQEPSLTLNLTASLNTAADLLAIESATLARPVGLAIEARGSVSRFTVSPQVDLNGHISYDLAQLQPQIRSVLGLTITAAGQDRQPFALRGPLADPALLVGDATLRWQSLSAYGFDVGPSALTAKMERGIVTGNAVEATFGQTGKVKLQPTLRITPGTYDLTFQQGRVIEKATLTPAATAAAIGFALPAIAKSNQAEGTFSFDLEEHRVLLMDINRSTLKGKLTMHNVSVTAGPVISEIAKLLGEKEAKLVLAKEQPVPIRVENGRVHHENLKLASHGYTITTSGSVGFDGSLSLTVEMPLPESALTPALKGVPKIAAALAGKRVTIPIGGTLSKPALDRRAFDAAVASFIKEVARDAVKGKLEDLFQKGLEKALPKKP